MAIESGKFTGQSGDIPKKRSERLPDASSLTRDTYRSIVGEVVALTNKPYHFDITAGELSRFTKATSRGRLDEEDIVGKEVTTGYRLGADQYSSFVSVLTLNESFGVATDPTEIVQVALFIDHEKDVIPNRYVHLNVGIKVDQSITYNLSSEGISDPGQTKAIESELNRWGVNVRLQEGSPTEEESNFNEQQGKTFLRALRELDLQ